MQQCSICHTEVADDVISCPTCGAMRITSLSPAGAIVGWASAAVAVCTVCLWSGVVVLPLMGISLSGFPWLALAVGTVLSVGLLWYARSTRRPRWIPR
ncbi:MAG: hypothetical protein LBE50_06980 [Gallionellaceae bacterium]|jgi:hypothetical protein|nr:hypothetical protein [Gallionellaceae bacterium]